MRTLALFLLAATLLGCNGGDRGDAPTPTPSPSPTASPSPTPVQCTTARSTLIHVLDDAGRLHSFDPAIATSSGAFQLVGTPNCTPGPALAPFTDPATPYALAVDDQDVAWILYTSGELFRVSTLDASCATTTFTPQQNTGGTTWSLFGTAFVTDSSGSAAERMWIAGGNVDGSLGDLGYVDPATLAVTRVGPLGGTSPSRPDLMGLSDATLWGFFPGTTTGSVQQIDRTTGALLGSAYTLPSGNTLVAWGAAHWSGSFWLFTTRSDGMTTNSAITTINRTTGTPTVAAQDVPHTITAAASSTCAPTE